MEAVVRKPFQGVTNIIRFNWHFYIIAIALIVLLLLSQIYLSRDFYWISNASVFIILSATLVSLIVSYYIYDYSSFYQLQWLKGLNIFEGSKIVNINAGFDETSFLLRNYFSKAELQVFDFYDPLNHTELSIERARKAYAPYPETQHISTSNVPLVKGSTDLIFSIFSLHEIRNRHERITFLKQLKDSLKLNGKCIVVEHLRDIPNFLAYNLGFFHFFSRAQWQRNFARAGFAVEKEVKINSFVSVFILANNGNTH